jgi:hypothetical protein
VPLRSHERVNSFYGTEFAVCVLAWGVHGVLERRGKIECKNRLLS